MGVASSEARVETPGAARGRRTRYCAIVL